MPSAPSELTNTSSSSLGSSRAAYRAPAPRPRSPPAAANFQTSFGSLSAPVTASPNSARSRVPQLAPDAIATDRPVVTG